MESYFLDEGRLKSDVVKKIKDMTKSDVGKRAHPEILGRYYPLFFEGCEFFNRTWMLAEYKLPNFWRGVVEILDYITLCCGYNTIEMWESDCEFGTQDYNGPLSTNYFAFSNENLLELASKERKSITVDRLILQIVSTVYGTPHNLILGIFENCATSFSAGAKNIETLIKNSQRSAKMGIFNPLSPFISSPKRIDITLISSALDIIPASLKKFLAKDSLEFSRKSILDHKPSLMLSSNCITSSAIQLELFARALAISSITEKENKRKFTENSKYKVISSFSLKTNWAIHGDYFGCMAHYCSADTIRMYRSILFDTMYELDIMIAPWNENTVYKTVIAAVWYVIIYCANITIENAYELVFDNVKKWKP